VKAKSIIVLFLIVSFMVLAYFLNKWLQKIIKPRQSAGQLLLYFLTIMLLVFILSFLMVFLISKLYPGELIK